MKLQVFKSLSIFNSYFWLGLFALLPLLLVLMISFMQHDENHLILFHFTAKNYQQLMDPIFFKILLLSFSLSIKTTLLCLIIAYPMAMIIAFNKTTHRSVLLILLIIPFWTSSLVRTYALFTLLKTKGLLNSALMAAGIIHHPLQLLYTNTAVLIGTTYNLLPFMILPIYSCLEKLDHNLIDAAKDLGARPLKIFSNIILPLSVSGIVAGVLLVFLPAMTLFYIPDLLGGAKSVLMGNLVQTQFLTLNDWPGGAATAIVLTMIMLTLIGVYRWFGKGDRDEIL